MKAPMKGWTPRKGAATPSTTPAEGETPSTTPAGGETKKAKGEGAPAYTLVKMKSKHAVGIRHAGGPQWGQVCVKGASMEEMYVVAEAVSKQLNNGASREDSLHLLQLMRDSLRKKVEALQ